MLHLNFKVDGVQILMWRQWLNIQTPYGFPLIACSCVAVEVKKEPEPPAEAVKQEEREPATKSSAPAPPSKPPPEKRARLQWESFFSHSGNIWLEEMWSPTALTERTAWEYFCSLSKFARSSAALLIWSVYRRLRMNWHKKCQYLVSVPETTFTL